MRGEATLTVRTPEGRQVGMADGEQVTVGRAGTIAIGRADRFVHEIVCIIVAGRAWTVMVPDVNRLWVDVIRTPRADIQDKPTLGVHRLTSVRPGTQFSCSEGRVALRVRTALASHRVLLEHDAPKVGRVRWPRRGSTEISPPCLSASDVNHRALIVACRERLTDPDGAALHKKEVARALGLLPDTADRRLSRAVGTARTWMEEAGEPSRGSRDEVIDWLVATGLVNTELMIEALSAESDETRRGNAV